MTARGGQITMRFIQTRFCLCAIVSALPARMPWQRYSTPRQARLDSRASGPNRVQTVTLLLPPLACLASFLLVVPLPPNKTGPADGKTRARFSQGLLESTCFHSFYPLDPRNDNR